MSNKSKKIKHILLGSLSIIALSTTVIAAVVGCTLSKSHNNINNHLKSNVNKTTSVVDPTNENNLILQQIKNNKTITIPSSKTYTAKSLKSAILKQILAKVANKCSNKQLTQLEKNLKINLLDSTSSSYNKQFPVTIEYDNKVLSNINVLISNSTWTSIAFAQTNYNINLQNGDSLSSLKIQPIVQNWQDGCEIKYSLQLDDANVYSMSTNNENTVFTIPSNVSSYIQNDLLPLTNNFATATLYATLTSPNPAQSKVTISAKITINNNPLFLYASSSFEKNVQSVNLNCFVNEVYSLSFIQYKKPSNENYSYYLVEEVNSAGNLDSSVSRIQLENYNASNVLNKTVNSINEVAKYGTITYYLELESSSGSVITSNSVTINCNKQGGVTITNPNINEQTKTINVDLSKTSKCVLTISNNVPGITYNDEDIYYQVAEENNEWLPITRISNLFKVTVQNNQLIFSNLASKIAINVKLANAETGLYSNIVTINTKTPNSIWTQFKNNDTTKTIWPGTSYNEMTGTIGETFNLNFIAPNINLSNVEYNWSMLTGTGFVSIGSNESNFTKTFTDPGVYVLRMQVTWDNDVNASPLNYLFKITIVAANQSTINSDTSKLNTYINNNLDSILLNYFQNSPSVILPYINTSTEYQSLQLATNVNDNNFNQYFSVNSVSFNSDGLLTVDLIVLNNLNLVYSSNSSKDTTINKGATLTLITPFLNTDFQNKGVVTSYGESEMNINITSYMNQYGYSFDGIVGWTLNNSNDTSINNQFMPINIYDVNQNDFKMNITSSNSNNALPSYFNVNNIHQITNTIIWNMQTSQYIRVDDVEGGQKTILFFPSFFPNPSSVSYSLYKVSGNEMNNATITGTLVSTSSSANFGISPNSSLIGQSFTYYCVCTYVINNVTYTARSQNILVTYTDGSTI
ncbi:MAG: hypothetical protein IIT78_00235 [Mycoplasmataceae bacterium]|nr:hypothetical protein [Mycoplasmataceae bacterium]